MKLYVDGDACPVKEIVLRAAVRTGLPMILVSNSPMGFSHEQGVTSVVVPGKPDAADAWIVEHVEAGDLVITADIPLAAAAVEKGAVCVGHRGERFDEQTIGERMSLLAFHRSMRDSGIEMGGPKGFTDKDRAAFANALDRLLQKMARKKP
ncbi:MAG: YaiI/YqxD family protein [Candidatus Sericytochromatia bacterium]|nr:YaiI/YqxD family protein [Candidatus Sericytochromatia bacterium]